MKTKFLTLLALASICVANAQDRTILETLVKKGTITEQEATQIARDSVVVKPGTSDTKKLSIYGGIDTWYSLGKNEVTSPSGSHEQADTNGFEMRYVKIGLNAEIQGGWLVDVLTDFGIEGRKRNYLDKVIISKVIDVDYLSGQLDVGLRKVNMGLEQGLDDFSQYTPERSIATWFFTRPDNGSNGVKNFGSRAIGVFFDGKFRSIEGLYYGLSVVGGNSYEGSSASLANFEGNNDLSFYVNVGYKSKIELNQTDLNYDLGLNFGYADGGFVVNNVKNEVWGANPYVSLNYKNVNLMLEYFIQNVKNGDIAANKNSTPMGFNGTVAYKFHVDDWGSLEPIFRASFVMSDGIGFNPVTMGTFSTNAGNITNLYDKAQTYYIGINWYLVPSVKFAIGYEWGLYTGGFNSNAKEAESNTVRAQLQVLF